MATAKADPVEKVLAALRKAGYSPDQVKDNQWESRCPVHNGSRSNLTITRADNGKLLLHCHHIDEEGENCQYDAILGALGLASNDVRCEENAVVTNDAPANEPTKPKVEKPRKANAKKVYPNKEDASNGQAWLLNKNNKKHVGVTWKAVRGFGYLDKDGNDCFAVIRLECKDNQTGTTVDKTYRPIHRVKDGWMSGDPAGKLPLYMLRTLGDATRVFVLEGEKCVKLAAGLGLVATTPAHGAQSPHKSDWSPLAGKEIVILPDADAPGEGFAKLIKKQLSSLSPLPTVRVVRLPNLPEKGDIEQWLAERPQDPDEHPNWKEEARAELMALADAAPAEQLEQKPTTLFDASHRADQDEDRKASILVTEDEYDVNDQAIRALASDPNLFHRGGRLITIIRDNHPNRRIKRVGNPIRMVNIAEPSIRERLTKYAKWWELKQTKNGEELKTGRPPSWCTSAIMCREEYPDLRYLEAVIEAPTLRADWSVLQQPGYDEQSGLFYEPSCEFPLVPDAVSHDEARAAAAELLELVCDFPFYEVKDDGGLAHRAAWLSSVLTPLARQIVDWAVPLFMVTANTAASGKSKLVDIAAILTTGRDAPRSPYFDDEAEIKKSITAIAIEGDRIVLFDNIPNGGNFGGAALDTLLTGITWKDRILGESRRTGELPMTTVWYATGNNTTLKGDMLRRVINVRLLSPEERPEQRDDFKIKELLKHVHQHRGQLVVAALKILRGYDQAGRPQAKLTSMDYQSWSRSIRQAIYWATGADPCWTRDALIEDDPKTNQLKAFVNGWAELPKASEGLTAASALKILKNSDWEDRFEILRSVMHDVSKDGNLPNSKMLGVWLRPFKGRVIDGKILDSRLYQGTQVWSVKPAEKKVGGSGGSGGSVSTFVSEKKTGPVPEDDWVNGIFPDTAGSGITPTTPTTPTRSDSLTKLDSDRVRGEI